MRFGIISDIHGNLPAFEAVCEAMGPVDRLLCAGDVVGYNPWPAACIDRVRELGAVTVRGNHDRAVAFDGGRRFNSMAKAGVRHAREELGDVDMEWLRSLPTEQFVADGRIHMVHGHPEDPDRYTYSSEFSASMIGEGVEIVMLGHTHVQEYRTFEGGIVLNPGSVGQPRNGDPKAAFAVVELDENGDSPTVMEHRVDYDIDRVIEAVEEAGLPKQIGTRLQAGK
ncbi:putative phosphoesterase [Halohasta litchfieldiae]|jgi:putative phosphoesterase|uniref:Phosphoesterase n=1 Tax=Halohasta litchfieldiae TaxID=1073996 RepID=A0A1H6QU73_9EURY|nr:metallophosphoesterase family protein [Halohasta litchfieldiae]ATW88667.1 putative phosphoesterase [Halohasta litchfieldiae]SEI47169.1 phosphoesterase, MJ0936 family [Halohasta litchfieldiae]